MKIKPADASLIRKAYQDVRETPNSGFGEMLKSMVADTNTLQNGASAIGQAAISGSPVEAHAVMIAGEEARLAFELMLEVRNRLVEAYRELMQMRM
jgi:flagellar hook-basal body complex protein FliE